MVPMGGFWVCLGALAHLVTCGGQVVVTQVFPAPVGGLSSSYDVPAQSIRVFSANVSAGAVPPACPSACPASGRLVCSGVCPADCYCADGWGLYFRPSLLSPTGGRSLAFSLSTTKPTQAGLSKAYAAFTTGKWKILDFKTYYEHMTGAGINRKKAIAWTKQKSLEHGMVNLCRLGGETRTLSALDCGCDDCANTCGVRSTRKFQSCTVGGKPVHVRYGPTAGCTYYAETKTLIQEAKDTDHCCNAIPSEFEELIGAVGEHAHAHDWRPTPRVRFPTLRGGGTCNTSTGKVPGAAWTVGELAYSRCSAASMTTGDYFLYVVNTGSTTQKLRIDSVRVGPLTSSEGDTCWEVLTPHSSAAARPSGLGLTIVLAYLAGSLLLTRT
jgi:hypothetical protein